MLFCLPSQSQWMSCCLLDLYFFSRKDILSVFWHQSDFNSGTLCSCCWHTPLHAGGRKQATPVEKVCWMSQKSCAVTLFSLSFWFTLLRRVFISSSSLFLKVVSAVNHGPWCCQFYFLVFHFSFCYILVCGGVLQVSKVFRCKIQYSFSNIA